MEVDVTELEGLVRLREALDIGCDVHELALLVSIADDHLLEDLLRVLRYSVCRSLIGVQLRQR